MVDLAYGKLEWWVNHIVKEFENVYSYVYTIYKCDRQTPHDGKNHLGVKAAKR